MQDVLLGLGALLLAVAAVLFLALNWQHLSLGARTAVIAGVTVAAIAASWALRTRRPATAEALSALGAALMIADAFAIRSTDLLGAADVRATAYWTAALTVLWALHAGSAALLGTRSMRWAASIIGPAGPALLGIALHDHGSPAWVVPLGPVLAVAATAGVHVLQRRPDRLLRAHSLLWTALAITSTLALQIDEQTWGSPAHLVPAALLPLALAVHLVPAARAGTWPRPIIADAIAVALTALGVPVALAVARSLHGASSLVMLGTALALLPLVPAVSAVIAARTPLRRGLIVGVVTLAVPAALQALVTVLAIMSDEAFSSDAGWADRLAGPLGDIVAFALVAAAALAVRRLAAADLAAEAAVIAERSVAAQDAAIRSAAAYSEAVRSGAAARGLATATASGIVPAAPGTAGAFSGANAPGAVPATASGAVFSRRPPMPRTAFVTRERLTVIARGAGLGIYLVLATGFSPMPVRCAALLVALGVAAGTRLLAARAMARGAHPSWEWWAQVARAVLAVAPVAAPLLVVHEDGSAAALVAGAAAVVVGISSWAEWHEHPASYFATSGSGGADAGAHPGPADPTVTEPAAESGAAASGTALPSVAPVPPLRGAGPHPLAVVQAVTSWCAAIWAVWLVLHEISLPTVLADWSAALPPLLVGLALTTIWLGPWPGRRRDAHEIDGPGHQRTLLGAWGWSAAIVIGGLTSAWEPHRLTVLWAVALLPALAASQPGRVPVAWRHRAGQGAVIVLVALLAGQLAGLTTATTLTVLLVRCVVLLAVAAFSVGLQRGDVRVVDISVIALGVVTGLEAVVRIDDIGGLSGFSGVILALALVVSTLALRPGRRVLWALAVVLYSLAWAARMLASHVTAVDAFTVPLGIALVALGAVVLHRSPARRSWPVLGPGLLVALVPSLFVAIGDPQPWRVMVLAVVAAGTVIVGAVVRLQAPVIVGTIVLVAHALVQLSPVVSPFIAGVPRWIYLALLGALLLGLGTTYEARIAQAKALRARIASLR